MTGDEFRLRGYGVERLIGRGATSEVWLGRVAGSVDRVALKRIPVDGVERRRSAHAEAALLAALDHPNLVRLLGLRSEPDAVVLVLDLAEGGSLADLLASRGRLTPGEVTGALAPIAAALAYLHEAGVVHGDVSAANILFTAAGVPLLADVGTARITGAVTAPPSYVDPLVARGQLPGPPSDVFMLAGVALHALAGEPTWPAPTAEAALELAAAGVAGLPDRLSALDLSPTLRAALGRAFAAEPGRRGTALDLALGLRHGATPVAVELAAGRPRPAPEAWSGPRHAAPPRRGRADADSVARPAFTRPGPAVPGGPPPTRFVGSRPRPATPRPRARPDGDRWLGRRLMAAALVVAVGLGAAWWLLLRPDGASGRAANLRVQVQPASEPVDWAVALARLDESRAAAFAHRDPGLLRRVYGAGPLLAADVALLRRLVPPGCGLDGVRTRYRDVRAEPAGRPIELRVTATLAPSTLRCGGRARGRAPGLGPVVLRLQLVRTRAGPRIVGLRQL